MAPTHIENWSGLARRDIPWRVIGAPHRLPVGIGPTHPVGAVREPPTTRPNQPRHPTNNTVNRRTPDQHPHPRNPNTPNQRRSHATKHQRTRSTNKPSPPRWDRPNPHVGAVREPPTTRNINPDIQPTTRLTVERQTDIAKRQHTRQTTIQTHENRRFTNRPYATKHQRTQSTNKISPPCCDRPDASRRGGS